MMISNKIMKRQMGEYDVLQRTSDSYFDGNALLQQWKHSHPKCKDSMNDFFEQKKVKEFIKCLVSDLSNDAQPQNWGTAKKEVVKYDKGSNTSKGRTSDKVWMHPMDIIVNKNI